MRRVFLNAILNLFLTDLASSRLPFAVMRAAVDMQYFAGYVASFCQIDDRVDNVGNIRYLTHRRKAL